MKLWQKDNVTTSEKIIAFTVGNDKVFDELLAKYDVQGSLAHATMLCKVGLLSQEELSKITAELNEILASIEAGTFRIDDSMEDIHSQIEYMLTEKVGDAGKKIHTGRSRNDQVLVDIKLYLKDEVLSIKDATHKLFVQLQVLSNKHKDKLMPGYTHMQVAMPSSFGLWFGAYAEALVDDMELLAAAYHIVNKNPLGSGAGYGSSFPLDRKLTTELLGFKSLNYNSIYAQMNRGKAERTVAIAIGAIAATLSRFSMDVCTYMSQNMGFLTFPAHLTTGSSIMPHKKNPDVFELIRAKCNRVQSVQNELALLMNNLPSGYHRDMQLTKEVLFPAIQSIRACMDIAVDMLEDVIIVDGILKNEKYKYLFTVEKINEQVSQGVAFRDAYKNVGAEVESGTFEYNGDINHTHEGSIGDLCNNEVADLMHEVISKFC